MQIKKGTAVLVAAAAAALAFPVLTAGPAQAHASCGRTGPDLDTAFYTANHDAVKIRTGSSTSCTAVGEMFIGHRLNYYCYTYANDGYTWTYLRDDATGKKGWSRDDLLPNYGSTRYCGF